MMMPIIMSKVMSCLTEGLKGAGKFIGAKVNYAPLGLSAKMGQGFRALDFGLVFKRYNQ